MDARSTRGFTLVEIVVAVGIIGVLVSVLVPTLATFRADADSKLCMGNLRQLMVAVETYRQHHERLLPPTDALPLATPNGPVGGLPHALDGILARDSKVHLCPCDHMHEWHGMGTSYMYLAGAGMLLLPIQPSLSPAQNLANAARIVSLEYDGTFAHIFPVIYDFEDRHKNTPRTPRNAVFIDGSVRSWSDEGTETKSTGSATSVADGSAPIDRAN
jgi:prepilin-type N-terminal cleavage/methylation domain-containing protein